ncbi:GNAT family N-acetyltransferase [Lachnospiraceae bacterium MD335]|jgi:RimJ/RimL family protein N-acetyltransferase|nr:GNAT family N-acetyltransferase [Lachnospiraceae bacterium MD335]
MFESGRLVYAIQNICKAKFCGYCAIKDFRKERPEIEIELLKEYRKKGIGYTVLCLLINELTNEYKVTDFVYCTDSDNYASQALVQKLGGKPNGLKRFFFFGEEEIEKFEKSTWD